MCRIEWLCADGTVASVESAEPADIADALGAIGRGAILDTVDGPVAVEDVMPGALIQTATGPERLLLKSRTHAGCPGSPGALWRISAGALGAGRPMPDLLVGPGAIVVRGPDDATVRDVGGMTAEALADGTTIIPVAPASAVPLYHLGFAGDRVVGASGLAMRSLAIRSLPMALPDLAGPGATGATTRPERSGDRPFEARG
jgi:hypothetical protein